MSSEDNNSHKNNGFVSRFIEVCGTDRPREIQKLLGISYQAVRNYLGGERLPDTKLLLRIADVTPYSIHWLLTGRGKKFAGGVLSEDTPQLSRQLNELVRVIQVEVMNDIDGKRDESHPQVVPVPILSTEADMDEVTDERATLSEKRPVREPRTAKDPDQ